MRAPTPVALIQEMSFGESFGQLGHTRDLGLPRTVQNGAASEDLHKAYQASLINEADVRVSLQRDGWLHGTGPGLLGHGHTYTHMDTGTE